MNQADPSSSCRAIENLIAAYAELVDDGDFAGVAEMLADATFTGGAGSVSGRGAIEKMLRESLIVYDDGTPRTKHVTTNVVIEVDEEAGTALSRSYFTALQALPDLALQPIVSGRYYDRFVRRDGQWRFVERRVRTDLIGDVSHHLRTTSTDRSPPRHRILRIEVLARLPAVSAFPTHLLLATNESTRRTPVGPPRRGNRASRRRSHSRSECRRPRDSFGDIPGVAIWLHAHQPCHSSRPGAPHTETRDWRIPGARPSDGRDLIGHPGVASTAAGEGQETLPR